MFELTYNIQRDFPFRPWFRRAVAAGFVILFGVFTVFNIATTGYDLQTKTTNDPNSTLTERHWFNNPVLTFGYSKLKPTCEAQRISVGDLFFSSNRGFTYSITALSTQSASQDPYPQTSISYLNNTLENCQVDSVVVNAKKADLSQPGPDINWWSWSTSTASASAHCNVIGPDTVSTIFFQVNYAGINNFFGYVIWADPKTKASVWWGTRLLDLGFTGIQALMANFTIGPPTMATMTYQANHNTTIEDPHYFNLSYFFLAANGGIYNEANSGDDVNVLYNNDNNDLSAPLTEGWYFAKIFQSLVLVDLGNNDTRSNLLLNESSVQATLNPQDDFNRDPTGPLGADTRPENTIDWWKIRGISPPNTVSNQENAVPMTDAWTDEAFTSALGPLGTKSSTIDTIYVCSVPQRKGNGAIVVIVFLGNWVFLSSAWFLTRFISTLVVTRRNPHAMYCEGCMKTVAAGAVAAMQGDDEWHQMVPASAGANSKGVGRKSIFKKRSSGDIASTSSLINYGEGTEVNRIM